MKRGLLQMLLVALVSSGCLTDPAPGLFRGKDESRNLDCTRYSQAQAHLMAPGDVPEVPVRSMPGDSTVLICTTRFLKHTDRDPRDEAILGALRQTITELISNVTALAPKDLTWHVDSFYPEPAVASKIAVAARIALAERGQRVSDRVPVLAAGDIAVLAHLPPKDAYRLACGRYFAEHVLAGNDAFLGLMIIDARESQLHAGICTGGRWKWLQ